MLTLGFCFSRKPTFLHYGGCTEGGVKKEMLWMFFSLMLVVSHEQEFRNGQQQTLLWVLNLGLRAECPYSSCVGSFCFSFPPSLNCFSLTLCFLILLSQADLEFAV